jgi:hypothetical protein
VRSDLRLENGIDVAPEQEKSPILIDSEKMTPLLGVRIKLARVWLIGAGLLFMILVMQSLLHVYGDLTQEAWAWFLPTVLPTLSMIISVLTYTALDPVAGDSQVRRSFVSIALWLSSVYLLTVMLTIMIQPYASRNAAEAVGLMRTSNLWLGPFQGLVASALGTLFASKEKKDNSMSQAGGMAGHTELS